MLRLTAEPIVLDDLLTAVADPKAGAVVVFIGMTRDNNEGRDVRASRVRGLRGHGGTRAREDHRSRPARAGRSHASRSRIAPGVVPIGMASVVIAVSSAHRGDAFQAARFTIDRLKEVVPIWKKEFFAGGAVWIGDQACRDGVWQESGETPSDAGGEAAGAVPKTGG